MKLSGSSWRGLGRSVLWRECQRGWGRAPRARGALPQPLRSPFWSPAAPSTRSGGYFSSLSGPTHAILPAARKSDFLLFSHTWTSRPNAREHARRPQRGLPIRGAPRFAGQAKATASSRGRLRSWLWLVAVFALYRPSFCRLEWHFAFFAADTARCLVHFSWWSWTVGWASAFSVIHVVLPFEIEVPFIQ